MMEEMEAGEMWVLRRMPRVSYADRLTNEEVSSRAGVQRELLAAITKRQLSFLGHGIGKERCECLALQ